MPNPTPHKATRRARRVVSFYGNDYLWVMRLIQAELKHQRKMLAVKKPNTTDYMIANRRVIECESVLSRLRDGRIEWKDE
jgi:hypothetical protein